MCQVTASAFFFQTQIAKYRPDAGSVLLLAFPVLHRVDIQFFRRRAVPEKIELGGIPGRRIVHEMIGLQLGEGGCHRRRFPVDEVGELSFADGDRRVEDAREIAQKGMDQGFQRGVVVAEFKQRVFSRDKLQPRGQEYLRLKIEQVFLFQHFEDVEHCRHAQFEAAGERRKVEIVILSLPCPRGELQIVHQLLVDGADLADRRKTECGHPFQLRRFGISRQEDRICFLPVPAGTARLLVIVLYCIGDVGMDHGANGGFVDAWRTNHPEERCPTDNEVVHGYHGFHAGQGIEFWLVKSGGTYVPLGHVADMNGETIKNLECFNSTGSGASWTQMIDLPATVLEDAYRQNQPVRIFAGKTLTNYESTSDGYKPVTVAHEVRKGLTFEFSPDYVGGFVDGLKRLGADTPAAR